MKVKAIFQILDSNDNVTDTLLEVTGPYTANQDEDMEFELTHDSSGGPLVTPKKFPKF